MRGGLTAAALLGLALVAAPVIVAAQDPAEPPVPMAAAELAIETVAEAKEALHAGNYERAVALLSQALDSGELPDHVSAVAYHQRGLALQKLGRSGHAVADYTNAIWIGKMPGPLLASTYYNRSLAYQALGQTDRSFQDLSSAIVINPDYASAYNNRANIYLRRREFDDAIADYSRSISLGNTKPHLPYFGRGLAREAKGDYAGAYDDFARAADLSPEYDRARRKLAELEMVMASTGGVPVQSSAVASAAPVAPAKPIPASASPVRESEPVRRAPVTAPPVQTVSPVQSAKVERTAPTPEPEAETMQAAVARAVAAPPRSYRVQVASYSSREAAEGAVSKTRSKHPSAVGDREAFITAADLGDRGQYYRLQFGPYADPDRAGKACDAIRGAGGDCLVLGP